MNITSKASIGCIWASTSSKSVLAICKVCMSLITTEPSVVLTSPNNLEVPVINELPDSNACGDVICLTGLSLPTLKTTYIVSSSNIMLESPMANRNRLALVIGMDTYDNWLLPPLESCKKDAEDVHACLVKGSYDISAKDLIIGSLGDQETGWIQFRSAVVNFFGDAKPSQNLLIYYSGHSLINHGNIYLATRQVDPNKPRLAGFSLSELTDLINECKAKRIVAIIDSCYSGTANLTGTKTLAKDNSKKVPQAIPHFDRIWKNVPKTRRVCLLLSSQAYEPSYSVSGSNSIFTKYLLEGLRGIKFRYHRDGRKIEFSGTVNDYGEVTTDLLHEYIYNKVASEEKQVPDMKQYDGSIILTDYLTMAVPDTKNLNEVLFHLLRESKAFEYNQIRRGNYNLSIDLNGRDLRGAQLNSVDLSEVNLRNALLQDASFAYANLYGASLMRANLKNANMTYAGLKHSNLREANLEGANLQYAYLGRADLQFANLSNACLIYASLVGCDLENATLAGANLYGTHGLPISNSEAQDRGAVFKIVSRSGHGINANCVLWF